MYKLMCILNNDPTVVNIPTLILRIYSNDSVIAEFIIYDFSNIDTICNENHILLSFDSSTYGSIDFKLENNLCSVVVYMFHGSYRIAGENEIKLFYALTNAENAQFVQELNKVYEFYN